MANSEVANLLNCSASLPHAHLLVEVHLLLLAQVGALEFLRGTVRMPRSGGRTHGPGRPLPAQVGAKSGNDLSAATPPMPSAHGPHLAKQLLPPSLGLIVVIGLHCFVCHSPLLCRQQLATKWDPAWLLIAWTVNNEALANKAKAP
jgi:hypothetical protein